jgi:hypothetical protein
MKNLIKQILKETINTKVVNLVLDRLNSNRIKPPYFKNLEDLGLSEEEIKLILGEFTKGKVDLTDKAIYDKRHGTDIYNEWGDGKWAIREYNKFGDITKLVESEGYWENRKYDERGNEIYREDSNGFWFEQEFDEDGHLTYFENSYGKWDKWEYNKNGDLIYHESRDGVKLDRR